MINSKEIQPERFRFRERGGEAKGSLMGGEGGEVEDQVPERDERDQGSWRFGTISRSGSRKRRESVSVGREENEISKSKERRTHVNRLASKLREVEERFDPR